MAAAKPEDAPIPDAIAVQQLRSVPRLATRLSARLAFIDSAVVPLERGMRSLGASGAHVSWVEVDELVELHSVGLSDVTLEAWRAIRLHRRTPMTHAVHMREAIWVAAPEHLASLYPDMGPTKFAASASIPILVADRVFGALSLFWSDRRRFGVGDLESIDAIASACAKAFSRAYDVAVADSVRRVKDEAELRTYARGIASVLQIVGPRPHVNVLAMLRGLKLLEADALAALALGLRDGDLLDEGGMLRSSNRA